MTKTFDIDYKGEIEKIYNKVKIETLNYFEKYGFKKAVLGLSGGLDSTICAVILAEILGAKNVYGIFMPSKITVTQSQIDAQEFAKNLEINYFEIPINPIVESLQKTVGPLFEEINKSAKKSEESYTVDNFQARTRANIIWAVSNEFAQTLPIATSDKSESYMGYATINGDMSGGFCPIADVLKTQLFAIAKYINEKGIQDGAKKNIIPQNIIEKPPSAELAIDPGTGKPLTAESALMPYPFMDEVIFRLEILGQNFSQMMGEEFYYEKIHKLSQEQKLTWLNKFANRVEGAVFKWNLMPEIAQINEKSLNRKEHFEKLKSLFV